MSYNNNWAKELKETFSAINKDSEQLDELFGFGKKKETPKPKAKKPAKPVKKSQKLDPKAMDYALGVHGKYTYDHVEHEGNNLQEEMALNEDLLMLIDVLCEELGIDVEELLSEDYTTVGRAKELTDDILAAVGRGDNRAAEKHMNTLILQGSDPKNVYGKGGKVLKKAAGFRRVPGAKKKTNKSK